MVQILAQHVVLSRLMGAVTPVATYDLRDWETQIHVVPIVPILPGQAHASKPILERSIEGVELAS